MPFEFLADSVTSDVTFRATGRDLDELFTTAVDATTHVMVADLDSVRAVEGIAVDLRADALDVLLVRLLEELVFHKDAAGLLLRAERLSVREESGGYRVCGRLCGEPIDRARHVLEADVKAVTWHGLHVASCPDGWKAQVTLDV